MNVCINVPSVVASQSFLAKTASFAATTIYTPAAAGVYRVSVTIAVNGTGTISSQLGWHDSYVSQIAALCNATGTTYQPDRSVVCIQVGASQAITLLGTASGGFTGSYDMYITIEQLA